jgi:CBS domain-containing protein
MSNVISDRVGYFLKDFPPFHFLSPDEIEKISKEITVEFYRPGQFVFCEGESGKRQCFILRKGNVKLLKSEDGEEQLIDQCEPGDVFGVRSLLSGNPYVMTALAEEESLVYAIKEQLFRHYLENNKDFALYFTLGYAAGQVIVRSDKSQQKSRFNQFESFEQETLEYSKEVVSCLESETILSAAQKMRDRKVGSIIVVDERSFPIGIVTDNDLRNKVVAENTSVDQPVSSIMSSPVKTINSDISVGEAMGKMLTQKVHHLVATQDGTINSPVSGIVSDHDVVVSQKNHPVALIKAIKRTHEVEKWSAIREEAEKMLTSYLKQEISIPLITGLISTINDTIIERAVQLGVQKVFGDESTDYCWLNLGSEGREEQLLRTDQDNAIIIADAHADQKERYLELGAFVNDILIQCGFVACPAEIMARNPAYCITLSEWQQLFDRWIRTPEPMALMNSTIFFDFRGGEGNAELVNNLESYLVEQIRANEIFLSHLAANALQNPPPLSFFKGFVVERSGEHKDDFDIKKRAMMPLSDAARVLTLGHGVTHIKSTMGRFRKLAELEPKNAALYEDAVQAYGILMRNRALSGLQNQDSGRFVKVESLNKLQKQLLKNAFFPIKELQELISVRYQSAYFS